MTEMDDDNIKEAIRADLYTSLDEAEQTYSSRKPINAALLDVTAGWLMEYPDPRAALVRYVRKLQADVEWRINFFTPDPEPADKADE